MHELVLLLGYFADSFLALMRYAGTVGERSNFKKIHTHTQDHGDAYQREGRVCPRTLVDRKQKR